jgi:hypothetical protein
MGDIATSALKEAKEQASTDRVRKLLDSAIEKAHKVARGEENAVPVIDGRWRFFNAYPQATMPDGRFAFHCERVVDIREERQYRDCLVFFDPGSGQFEVRQLDRKQWAGTGFEDRSGPPARTLNSVIDRSGGLWLSGGFRCGKDGRIAQLTPAGLKLHVPRLLDTDGRIYAETSAPNTLKSVYVYLPSDVPAVAAQGEEPIEAKDELHVPNVRALFKHSDVRPPWNAWAIQSNGEAPESMLRLDGKKPTRVTIPDSLNPVATVVPIDGGCIVLGRSGALGMWDGTSWDVKDDVTSLIERHGQMLVNKLPTRVLNTDTSGDRQSSPTGLFLASDGRGGLWVAQRAGGQNQMLHWDGKNFSNLWAMMPLQPKFNTDGAVLTNADGHALVVQLQPDDVRPGGYWAFYRVTRDDYLRDDLTTSMRSAGLHLKLLAAVGPDAVFTAGLWSDREGWIWSPVFNANAPLWGRRLYTKVGFTPVPRVIGGNLFAQGKDGPTWLVTGHEPARCGWMFRLSDVNQKIAIGPSGLARRSQEWMPRPVLPYRLTERFICCTARDVRSCG